MLHVTWSLTCLSSGLVSAWPAYTALLLRPREGVLAPWAPPWPPPTSCRDDDGNNQGDYDDDDNHYIMIMMIFTLPHLAGDEAQVGEEGGGGAECSQHLLLAPDTYLVTVVSNTPSIISAPGLLTGVRAAWRRSSCRPHAPAAAPPPATPPAPAPPTGRAPGRSGPWTPSPGADIILGSRKYH